MPNRINRSCCSESGRPCTTCSSPPKGPPRSTSPNTSRRTFERSSDGWPAPQTRTTGAHSSSTHWRARVSPTPQRTRFVIEKTRRAPRSPRCLRGDARCADPLEGNGAAPYGTVISAYCADSATADPTTWETYMRNIAGLVAPGGLFITAALRRCSGYVVGGKVFPSACVDEDDLRTRAGARLRLGRRCHRGVRLLRPSITWLLKRRPGTHATKVGCGRVEPRNRYRFRGSSGCWFGLGPWWVQALTATKFGELAGTDVVWSAVVGLKPFTIM